jgi:hypothetical protein
VAGQSPRSWRMRPQAAGQQIDAGAGLATLERHP